MSAKFPRGGEQTHSQPSVYYLYIRSLSGVKMALTFVCKKHMLSRDCAIAQAIKSLRDSHYVLQWSYIQHRCMYNIPIHVYICIHTHVLAVSFSGIKKAKMDYLISVQYD